MNVFATGAGTEQPPSARVEHSLDAIRGRTIDILVREDVKFSGKPIFAEIFEGLGLDARLVPDDQVSTSAEGIVFISGSPLWHKRALARIRSLPPGQRPFVILWYSEPLPLPRAAGLEPAPLTIREIGKILVRDRRISDVHSNARCLRRLGREGIVDLLTVATKGYQAYLAQEGIAAELIPVGYHPTHGHLLDLERDIDVLFLGDLRVGRRKRIFRQLEREGLPVRTIGSYSDGTYWGDARTEIHNRAKIVLNVPRHPGLMAESRWPVAMSTGALLLSEPVYLPEPYVPGAHYVEAEVDEMTEAARPFLDDESARLRITTEAHRFMTSELTLERSFARLLALAADRVAARG